MLTLEQIRERLKNDHMKINKVAEGSGLHPNAVYRMMRENSKPSYETVKKLSDYLEGKEAGQDA